MSTFTRTGAENASFPLGKGGPTTRSMHRAALGDVGANSVAAAAHKAPHTAAASGAGASDVAMASTGLAATPVHIHDIDAMDAADPNCFTSYIKEVYEHYRAEEKAKGASPSYMRHQKDINEKMRSILIDWLSEVAVKFRLMPSTMWLTVAIIDRFLERKMVVRQRLQLVGVSAMLIASKHEEIYAPEVRDMIFITDSAYNREQILAMEAAMLNALKFRITLVTPLPFLTRFLKAARSNTKLEQLATYFAERTMQEYGMLKYLPSMIAASSVNMALRSLGHGHWDATMEHYTHYTERNLRRCVRDMEAIMTKAPTSSLKAIYKKYAGPKYGEVALVPLALMV